MKVHVLQHSSINTLGTIEEYTKTKNNRLESTRFYETISPPELESFDLLIIMGGPIGVYDYKDNPWLRDEKAFIKQAIEAGKTILGICLGAQLLADILGARVYENRHVEMGWFPVRASGGENKPEFFEGLPDKIMFFHWHSRTFDLPAGAVQLFESEGCRNQGFIYNDRVIALQFHPEVNEDRILSLIKWFGDGMENGPFVQKKEEMLGKKEYLDATKKFMFLILDKLKKLI
ncbi:type 1 glutamine amidotransferase [Methanosarcina barkeri]|uniref:Glutamine amidotransferase class-I n=1 Tax=Methanosarcina barkeri 227 TaxID=1434106 RepID=A0A0E3R0N0_METBA|nr:type 1 glutamine amidotransferase [Methanosarcina barkeri]AKB56825.1 Glutamine amidotransferase class-I [Methanosarcina barkeri 227]